LQAAGVHDRPQTVLADAGYWNRQHIEALAAEGLQSLVPPDANRNTPRPGRFGGIYDWMRKVLATEHGGALFGHRQAIIEPVFGHLKHNRRADRFQRGGRATCRSEWRLLAATHNLLKLYRASPTPAERPTGSAADSIGYPKPLSSLEGSPALAPRASAIMEASTPLGRDGYSC
jgi:Transposase DDE domain